MHLLPNSQTFIPPRYSAAFERAFAIPCSARGNTVPIYICISLIILGAAISAMEGMFLLVTGRFLSNGTRRRR